MEDSPLVIVILVNWNRPEDTIECISSIRRSTYRNYRIIVVDNGSTDNSVQSIRGAGVDVLLETGENTGFTGGNNAGMRAALAQGADYVFLLNNDTIIAADCIDKMVSEMMADSSIGIISPKILFYGARRVIWFGGSRYDPMLMSSRSVGYGFEDKGQCDAKADVPWVTGCAMFMRREAVEATGFLNDDFFAVSEDLDYSLRMAKNGYRICYMPAAVIWHKEAMSSGGFDAPQYVYYQTRNFILMRKRWAGSSCHLTLSLTHIFAYFGKRMFQFLCRGKWLSIAGIILGIYDGVVGVTGRKDCRMLLGR